MSLLVAILLGFFSIMLPGFFVALALLRKTTLNMFEIVVIGFILGLILPATAVWLEAYAISYIPFFSFSETLYNINVVAITLVGIALCFWQGALDFGSLGSMVGMKPSMPQFKQASGDYRKRVAEQRATIASLNLDVKMVKEHEAEEEQLRQQHREELASLKAGPEERARIEKSHADAERRLYEQHESEERSLLTGQATKIGSPMVLRPVWIVLIVLMALTFTTRIINIQKAPTYFEFDPYFDMISTQDILTYGYQLHYSHEAWPTLTNGTVERLQPIVPYLEAYWYDIAGGNVPSANSLSSNSVSGGSAAALGNPSGYSPPNTTLLSLVSSWYPPIVAALLVFVVFLLLYHLYGEIPAVIGAALAATMPTLITTFIAGEQLLEPWGIFAMFFFVAAYLLATKYPKERRFAILAGIAFASNFLGAHYYTVTTGILAIYIVLQGIINIMQRRDNRDFYILNAIVVIIVAITYALYGPYEATLTQKTSSVLGIPEVVAFPLLALLFVFVLENLPRVLKERNILINKVNTITYVEVLAVFVIIALLLVAFTPLGKPFKAEIALSEKYTTPSSPLFMTVQEYAPTGPLFNFGSNGFGPIGLGLANTDILVWIVLLAFFALMVLSILNRQSQTAVFLIALLVPLMLAGMSEVKYLPHLGVGYLIVVGVIFGEAMILTDAGRQGSRAWWAVVGIGALIILLECVPGIFSVFLAFGASCSSVANSGNSVGYSMYCNNVPDYWLAAMSWTRNNVGPYAPRILSWWDYGDWINWFGNSNAVIRGDNSVAQTDYQVAAEFVLGPSDGFNSTQMAHYMDTIQSKYVLFDDQIVPKWGALDFLACIDTNQTSYSYAVSQGKAESTPQPYALGTSPCETTHDPAELIVPANASISDYCPTSNTTTPDLESEVILGNSPTNITYCVPVSFLETGKPTYLLNQNGTKTNAILSTQLFEGVTQISGQLFYIFIVIYAPNGPNDSITDAPSEFYNSNYYKGYFLGYMPGFTHVYPHNFTGINYVNSTEKIQIFEVNNYTGGNPPHTSKPSWIKNNYTVPG